ncbi:hypothetical protein FF011L_08590 [Roseimaritima multifibrata]|uniref:Tetratricopeptide repeat protein n=1 Tax=Roseimaritima multifibrata TaxID=1930274 RepID=A0A517MB55_9BACT|nr:hypothetical protein [Roseimaritima multifibrata]QDS92123.1 hypothetical protein FF011L_08590 [Roseimaritima multifibrata]
MNLITLFRVRFLCLLGTLACWQYAIPPHPLLGAGTSSPQRRTEDWQQDLISVLLNANMLQTAEAICIDHLRNSALDSDVAARWTIRLSTVRTARMVGQSRWEPELAQAARQPIEQLLKAYPQHPRRLWLETQSGLIDLSTARHAAVAMAISPGDTNIQNRGLQATNACLKQFEDIREQIDASGETENQDLQDLRSTIGQQRVEAWLLQSQLFPRGSEDAIASLTTSEREAVEVMSRIPTGTNAHSKLQALRIKALIQTGRPEEALEILDADQRARNSTNQSDPDRLALRVQVYLAQENLTAANEILQRYYGNQPQLAPPSADLDLARLDSLLATAKSIPETERSEITSQIADWLEVIGQRNGDYVRRQGEAAALQVVRGQPSGGDTRLMVAEAALRLKAGDLLEAGEWLTQAAAAASEPEQALKHATQAAAVLKQAEEIEAAVQILAATSLRFRQHASAPATHLQASWLLAEALKQEPGADLEPLQALLRTTSETWPQTSAGSTATSWLVRILVAKRKYAEAAYVAFPKNRAATPSEVEQATGLWQMAVRVAEDAPATLKQAIEHLSVGTNKQPQPTQEAAAVGRMTLEVLYAGRSVIEKQADQSFPLPDLIARLFAFRRSPPNAIAFKDWHPTSTDPAEIATLQDAIQRLFLDGGTEPARRVETGKVILQLQQQMTSQDPAKANDDGIASNDMARALIWSGDWEKGKQIYQDLIQSEPGNLKQMTAAAKGLSESDQQPALRESADLYNQIAAGLPQGSSAWHRAKQAAIQIKIRTDDSEEAMKLCRYILLTQPPQDVAVRERYQQLLEQAQRGAPSQ